MAARLIELYVCLQSHLKHVKQKLRQQCEVLLCHQANLEAYIQSISGVTLWWGA